MYRCDCVCICVQANAPLYDLEENLLLLPHLNESSLLYVIRQRFASNLVHTYVGKHVLYVNPMNALNCFSEKVRFVVAMSIAGVGVSND